MNDLDELLTHALHSDADPVEPQRPDALRVIRRRGRTRRAFVVGSSLILAIAVASATTSGLRAVSSSTQGSLKTSSDPHFRQAMDEAQRLLNATEVPPGATEVSSAPVELLRSAFPHPEGDHLIDRARWWIVQMSFDATVSWVQQHPPAHLKGALSGTGSGPQGVTDTDLGYSDTATDAYLEPTLGITIAPYGQSGSAMRADGMDVWITTAPRPDARGGPYIRVDIRKGCPGTLDGYMDVTNTSRDLAKAMLPSGAPLTAIVCRYRGPGPGEHGTHLARRTNLSQTDARNLARTINQIRLGSDGDAPTSCPMDQGVNNIIVFGYPHGPDIDLWFHPQGCSFLDNGFVFGGEPANLSYGSFYELVTSLTR